ncbi:hypothetical protein [Bradyrhizobium sp. STM 3557]|uniref:hypothetical protein n=1 Tax=Bradyrhizobium sp. STM 3557 TaxID=578920 RepID=UPI00388F8638
MTEAEKARQVHAALQAAQAETPDAALPILNSLIGLVRSDSGDQPIEVEEARSSAFLAICEVGKALHRGQPAGPLWAAAIAATDRWLALVT